MTEPHQEQFCRTGAVVPMTLEAARGMRGTGWSGDLNALRSNRIN